MKKNLVYDTLVDCMYQNNNGEMEYREQVVVFRKDRINHIARIITYVDVKKHSKPASFSASKHLDKAMELLRTGNYGTNCSDVLPESRKVPQSA